MTTEDKERKGEEELEDKIAMQIKVAYTWGLRAGQLPIENDKREARVHADSNGLEQGLKELMPYIDANYISKSEVLEAIPEMKDPQTITIQDWEYAESKGYNQAIKEIRQTLNLSIGEKKL